MAWLLCLPAGQASYLASSYRSTLFLAHRPKAGFAARDQRFESVSLQRRVSHKPDFPRHHPRLIFDQSIGQVFVTRVAGNIATSATIASLEYGVAVLGTKAIIVLGHADCGARQSVPSALILLGLDWIRLVSCSRLLDELKRELKA